MTSTALATASEAERDIATAPVEGGEPSTEPRSAAAASSPAQVAKSILLTAAWVGLATGALEGVYWLWRQQVLGKLVFIHPNFLWMSPAAQLAIFLLVSGALAITPWIMRPAGALAFATTLLFMLAWLNLLLLSIQGIHFWAWLLLAGGLAATTGRFFQKHADWCLRFFRRTAGWMVLVLVMIAVVQEGVPRLREASHVAALPDSPAAAPNVLLLVLDTVRADALGFNGGNPELTPNLDRVAKRGVVFNQAWSTAPWTLPSQAGMFTGRLPHEISVDWMSKLDTDHPTIAEKLSARGWLTGGFVGNTRYCSAETGLDRGFSHYDGYRHSWVEFLRCTSLGRFVLHSPLPTNFGVYDIPGRKGAAEVGEAFLSWLDRRGKRPYFAFLNFWDVHDPYFAPLEFARRAYSADEKALLRRWWWTEKQDLTPQQVELLRGAYEDCLRGLDHQLGLLLDELQQRGDLENTLIIVTADHGEHFGDHDLYLHGNSLYEPLLHVPLLLVWPERIPGGRRVDTPVSLQGLGATILQLVGEEPSLPGESLVRHWEADSANTPEADRIVAEIASQAGCPPCHGRSPVAAGPMQCARIGEVKYILNGDGRQELYNLASDPDETENLADDAEKKARILSLFAN